MARGILVAICSKNDPAEAAHLPALLGQELLDGVVDVHLGWGPKSAASADLADRLNLGLDAFVLFDDNPRERAEVAQAHPEVGVHADTEILASLGWPQLQAAPHLTAEAAARADSYRQQAARAKQATSRPDVTPEEFLHSLELALVIRPAADADLPRVAELLARTNQLNATGRRTDLARLRDLQGADGAGIVVAAASDRFGDYGLIGAATFQDEAGVRVLGELAFSCRAMGRGIEGAVLSHLGDLARAAGLDAMAVAVVETSRNAEMIRILGEAGFAPGGDGRHLCRLAEVATTPHPAWLDVDATGVPADAPADAATG
jgi:FkbH-like protein